MQYRHFRIEEREKIQVLGWERRSVRAIARTLGRPPSSVSRELRRNFPPERKQYTPRLAQQRAQKYRSHRGRTERLKSAEVRAYVIQKLKGGWSPEQISGRLGIDLPDSSVSHEAIYQYIYAQFHRAGDGRCLTEDLRIFLKRRHRVRFRKGFRKHQRLARFPVPSIDDRPAIVDRRSRIGDWESDTVESRDHHPGINTLVERRSGLVYITKLSSKSSAATADAITRRFSVLPPQAKQTITFDNGPENARWQELESAIGIHCFFAHPYCSGERGTNENTNGLTRWYWPKKTDFRTISSVEISAVESALNHRPRKRLGWLTPYEVFIHGVALAG